MDKKYERINEFIDRNPKLSIILICSHLMNSYKKVSSMLLCDSLTMNTVKQDIELLQSTYPGKYQEHIKGMEVAFYKVTHSHEETLKYITTTYKHIESLSKMFNEKDQEEFYKLRRLLAPSRLYRILNLFKF